MKLLLGSGAIGLVALKWAAFGLLVGGIFATAWFTLKVDSLPYRLWARYVNYLEADLQLMFHPTRGRSIALGQLGVLAAIVGANAIVTIPFSAEIALLACIAPPLWIRRMKAKRLEAIEQQLNTFTVTLANALKTTPSVGDALRITGDLLSKPFQDDVQLAVKSMRFGASVEQALTLTASRLGSPDVDTVFSALLIGRNIGGDLPTILDTTAASLREMTRLQQVLRTKTAEGRSQVWVLAMFPFGLMFAMSQLQPGFYDVLTRSATGYVLAVIAGLCWAGSILIGRKIMAIEM
jgi:tight adherence protein B